MTKGKQVANGMQGPSADIPVFEVDTSAFAVYPNGDELPAIWITAPVKGGQGKVLGRIRTRHYPSVDEGGTSDDPNGEDALYYGGCYYDEAMGYTDPADHENRVDCFRAAELLYRHSAGKGNPVANLCLGYVYSYDRCEGSYWTGTATASNGLGQARPYPRKERAFECLDIAAEAGIPEACYKLGDLYKHGTGCTPDAAAAFRCYKRASELSAYERPVILGSIALRLAECFEEGIGCEQDFRCALKWYRKAVQGLDAAVETGDVWYAKALASARAGVKRCQQETA